MNNGPNARHGPCLYIVIHSLHSCSFPVRSITKLIHVFNVTLTLYRPERCRTSFRKSLPGPTGSVKVYRVSLTVTSVPGRENGQHWVPLDQSPSDLHSKRWTSEPLVPDMSPLFPSSPSDPSPVLTRGLGPRVGRCLSEVPPPLLPPETTLHTSHPSLLSFPSVSGTPSRDLGTTLICPVSPVPGLPDYLWHRKSTDPLTSPRKVTVLEFPVGIGRTTECGH